MTKRKLIALGVCIMLIMASCSSKETMNDKQDKNVITSPEPTTTVTDLPEPTAVVTDTPIPTPTEAPKAETPAEPIIIDGFDLTKALSGPALKDVYGDYFKIGAGLYGYNSSVDTINSEPLTEIIKYHFNSTTYTNLMKPQHLLNQQMSIENHKQGLEEPGISLDTAKKGLEFCMENNIQMRGHVLVWHAQTPDWFFREGFQNDGEFVDRETMLIRLESYIKQVLEACQTNYPGVIYAWDVVNEAIENTPGRFEKETGFSIRTKHGDDEDNLWYTIVGTDYVEKSFEYARKYADPEVKLFYNDYNTFQPTRTIPIKNLALDLKEKGLIDGIGMQGYMSLGYPGLISGNDNVMKAITTFAETGLEIHITELSISMDDTSPESLEKQAARYKTLLQILTGLDTASGKAANITSVTFFGVQDGYHLYPEDKTNTRLFDGQMQPKPAFYSVLEVAETMNKN